MGMTWANDETGLLVIAGTGKPGKKAKVKTPKPEKADKRKSAPMATSRPSMPGMPPPRDAAPPPAAARPGLLDTRPSVPIGVPIVRAPMRGMTSGASTAVHSRRSSRGHHGHPFLRSLGVMFVVVVIAAGGFAAGALTELGTEAETFVLGPTPPVAPASDPRVPALQADVTRLENELAEERKISIEMRTATAPRATDDAAIELGEAAPAVEDDKKAKDKKRKHKSRRSRDKRRIDL
jgi:hypothetical protein